MRARGDALQCDAGEPVQALGLEGPEIGHGIGLDALARAQRAHDSVGLWACIQ